MSQHDTGGTVSDERGSAGLPGVRLVLRRSWWMALGLAVGLAAGVGTGRLLPPVYESTAILTVSSSGSADASSVSRAAQALARLATEPGLVSSPLRDAGLADAADRPREYVQVQAAPNAPIMSVTGTATDPQTAQQVAETVSRGLTDLQPYPPFTATVVAEPPLPRETSTPGWTAPAGGGGLGTALALILAATVPRRRTASERPAGREVALPPA
jgi:uncharacterized protein involved in exopolysaccharide biosynthesis